MNVQDMLDRRNPVYNPHTIESMDALYQGGSVFGKIADRFLHKRAIETGNDEMRKARLNCSHYVPLAGFVINTLTGAGTSDPVMIDASGTDAAYFNALNDDANENGDDLPSVCAAAIREAHVQGRSYLAIDFPDATTEPASLADQKESGELNGRICALRAVDVDDWYPNCGPLEYARTCGKKFIRNPFGDVTVEYRFKVWTATYTQEFIGSAQWVAGKPEPTPKEIECVVSEPVAHSVGVTPIYALDVGIWTMDQLAPVAIALFNRDTATTYALNAQAFSILVLKLNQNAGAGEAIKIGPTGILTLDNDPGTDAKYISSNTAQFDAQENNAKALAQAMMMTISMLAAQASPSDYQRTPAAAVGKSSAALEVILRHFAKKLKDALGKALDGLKAVRGSTDTINIRGMDTFSEGSLTAALNELILAKSAGLPPAAVEYLTREAALSAVSGAPANVREAVAKAEIEKGIASNGGTNSGTSDNGNTGANGGSVSNHAGGA